MSVVALITAEGDGLIIHAMPLPPTGSARLMTKRTCGHTKSGTPITDELIEELAEEAEAGYDVDEIIARRRKRGRPRLGTEPSTVESVRLDPDLKARLLRRADDESVSASEVIRDALRQHLEAS